MKNRDSKDNRYLLILVLIFVLLTGGIIAAGYRYYSDYAANYRARVENQLTSTAELKVQELVHWREVQLGDAGLFYKNPVFSALVRRYLDDGDDAEAGSQLRTWLDHTLGICPYERIDLLDPAYNTTMMVPGGAGQPDRFVSAATAEALQSGKVAFEDFYYDSANQKIILKLMVPIFDSAGQGRKIGFLAMRIDPANYLYPMLRLWPAPSTTAETLIVRRDGGDVLFLNELRFQQDTALKFRISLDKTEVPSVKAALGYAGIVEGTDYRGEEVIAAVRGIPGSPWMLVARMDKAEVYAPLTQMLWVVMVLVAALITGSGAAVGLVWRQRSRLIYKERAETAEALRESDEKFREAFEELKRSNAELERFTYTISHDLKSPLVTIKTFLGYLKQDMADSDAGKVGKDMLFMEGAADKMGRLLDELLEMSRIGRVINPPVKVTFAELVHEALGIVAGGIQKRDVAVQVSDEVLDLYGDRPRLVEIWQNLLENAVKFMGEQASPQIDIGVQRGDAGTVFFVRDNGMGIDPRHVSRVFDLFDKLDARSEGTGLGLAIVKRIVELYNGAIWFESVGPGQGSCVSFTLPAAQQGEGQGEGI